MDEERKGYLMCFFGVFTWSFSEIVVKLLQGGVGPVSLSFHRFFFGALFLLLIMICQKDLNGTIKIVKNHPMLAIMASMIGLGISNIIYFIGLHYTQANIGAALYSTYPLFISIYAIFILGERTNLPQKFLGYIIGFIGMFILITNFQLGLLFKPENIIGNVLLVLAAAIWGFYSVLGKKIFKLENGAIPNIEIKWTAISFLLSCVPIIIILPFTGETESFFVYDTREWALIMFMAFFTTGFGLYIFFVGLRKLEVSKGMSLALLKPIMAMVLSYLILDELPTVALIVSIPLVSIAVLLINRQPKQKR